MAILTVFGATGLMGKELVKQALAQGYTVRAYGRNIYTAGFAEQENLELVQGALFDDNQVYDAVKGADYVLSAIGGAFTGGDQTRSLGMKHIVSQMKKAGVKRIVGIGGMGILDVDDDKTLMDTPDFPKEYLEVTLEHAKAYRILKESSLDWTFVCPPNIADAPAAGHYVTEANRPPEQNKYSINSGDLAAFMLGELKSGKYIGQRVGISN